MRGSIASETSALREIIRERVEEVKRISRKSERRLALEKISEENDALLARLRHKEEEIKQKEKTLKALEKKIVKDADKVLEARENVRNDMQESAEALEKEEKYLDSLNRKFQEFDKSSKDFEEFMRTDFKELMKLASEREENRKKKPKNARKSDAFSCNDCRKKKNCEKFDKLSPQCWFKKTRNGKAEIRKDE